MITDLCIWNPGVMRDLFGGMAPGQCVAVVGNGPMRHADAMQVEVADVVVRFNNWGSRRGLRERIVSGRCDILVGNFDCHTTNMGEGIIERPALAVLGIPFPHHASDAERLWGRFYPRAVWAMTNPWLVRSLTRELGYSGDGITHPMPTVGMTAIYHLYKMNLPPRVHVCGFDWHYDEITDTIDGVAVDTEHLPQHFNHFYAKEVLWVARNCFRKPGWSFSNACSAVLERFHLAVFPWERSDVQWRQSQSPAFQQAIMDLP